MIREAFFTLGRDHFTLGRDHFTLGRDHFTLGRDHFTLGRDHFTLGRDHFTLGRQIEPAIQYILQIEYLQTPIQYNQMGNRTTTNITGVCSCDTMECGTVGFVSMDITLQYRSLSFCSKGVLYSSSEFENRNSDCERIGFGEKNRIQAWINRISELPDTVNGKYATLAVLEIMLKSPVTESFQIEN
jgi:hypothetical protein